MRGAPVCLALLVAATGATAAETHRVRKADRAKIDASVHKQVARCWSPSPSPEGTNVGVRVEFELNPSGAIVAAPLVRKVEGYVYTETANAAAVRAVQKCAPYKLPAKAYAYWRNVGVNFLDRPLPPAEPAPASPQ